MPSNTRIYTYPDYLTYVISITYLLYPGNRRVRTRTVSAEHCWGVTGYIIFSLELFLIAHRPAPSVIQHPVQHHAMTLALTVTVCKACLICYMEQP